MITFRESILSSVHAGKFADDSRINTLFDKAGFSNNAIQIKTKKGTQEKFVKVKGNMGFDCVHDTICFKNLAKSDIDMLNRIIGIYGIWQRRFVPVDLAFYNTDNLVLDLSNWDNDDVVKGLYYKFMFYNCKNISILGIPEYTKPMKDFTLHFHTGCTINNLPKDMFNAKLVFYDYNVLDINKIKNISCKSIELDVEALGIKHEGMYSDKIYNITPGEATSKPVELKHEFNKFIEPLANSKIKAKHIGICDDVLINYDKNTDSYFFIDEVYL